MRIALADKMQNEMSSALLAAKQEMKNHKKESKKMIRADPLDPKLVEKYGIRPVLILMRILISILIPIVILVLTFY